MTTPTPPQPVNLICGVLYAQDAPLDRVVARLTETFGPVEMESDVFPFTQTDYYTPEMGPGLFKKFYSFEKLISPEAIAEIKITTNRIESEFTRPLTGGGAGRVVNLDPGYISLAKFVLATTKDHAHRLYLRDGIHAEVTLRFLNGSFAPLEWTYPDFRTREYIEFLNRARDIYHKKLKSSAP